MAIDPQRCVPSIVLHQVKHLVERLATGLKTRATVEESLPHASGGVENDGDRPISDGIAAHRHACL
jgi:hypothetical protein